MSPHRRDRCRYCGAMLPAWLPAAKRSRGALLLGQQHLDQVGPYPERMRT